MGPSKACKPSFGPIPHMICGFLSQLSVICPIPVPVDHFYVQLLTICCWEIHVKHGTSLHAVFMHYAARPLALCMWPCLIKSRDPVVFQLVLNNMLLDILLNDPCVFYFRYGI